MFHCTLVLPSFHLALRFPSFQTSTRSRSLTTQRSSPLQAFADTYPLHVLTLPTLKQLALDLSNYAENPLPFDVEEAIQRFRPNVVVELPEGTEPFEEDGWGLVEIGEGGKDAEGQGWGLEVVGRCGRCTVRFVSLLLFGRLQFSGHYPPLLPFIPFTSLLHPVLSISRPPPSYTEKTTQS